VLNQTVRSELGLLFLDVQHDATIRCVVFESGERCFCAGAGLRE
jgi:enoyl-CoA hydratase/carnithine racemase